MRRPPSPAIRGGEFDCNRRLDDPTSIAQISDNVEVPGNRGLSASARQARGRPASIPIIRAIEDLIAARRGAGRPTALISMHSFTRRSTASRGRGRRRAVAP